MVRRRRMEVRHRFIITFLIESSRCLDGCFLPARARPRQDSLRLVPTVTQTRKSLKGFARSDAVCRSAARKIGSSDANLFFSEPPFEDRTRLISSSSFAFF